MKSLLPILTLFIIVTACKTEKKTEDTPVKNEEAVTNTEMTIPEKIADAHGFENWKKINQIQFKFNVERGGKVSSGRTWNWRPKTNDVLFMSETDTLAYNRKNLDSISKRTNGGFVNDKFWLLAPFNLIWDKNSYTYTHTAETEAPISKKTMQKLTVVYGDKGGYTPGDAYDYYFEDNYILKEWVFRKSNAEKASLATTWENYTNYDGLKIALDHKNAEGTFRLFFDGVKTIAVK